MLFKKKKQRNRKYSDNQEFQKINDSANSPIDINNNNDDNEFKSFKNNIFENNFKSGFADPSKNKENKFSQKILALSLLILLLFGVFMITKTVVKYAKKEISKEQTVEANLVSIPDLNGIDVESANEILHSLGIKTQIRQSYNDFFDIDAVIKMSVDPGNLIKKGSTIILYVCKPDNIEAVQPGSHYFDNVYIENVPIRKNGISVDKIEFNDNIMVVTLTNKTNSNISSLLFTVGYIDSIGDKFLNKSSIHLGLNIKPHESFTLQQKTKNPKIKGVSVEKIDAQFFEESGDNS